MLAASVVPTSQTMSSQVVTLVSPSTALALATVGEVVEASLTLVTLPTVHVGHTETLARLHVTEVVSRANVVTTTSWKITCYLLNAFEWLGVVI